MVFYQKFHHSLASKKVSHSMDTSLNIPSCTTYLFTVNGWSKSIQCPSLSESSGGHAAALGHLLFSVESYLTIHTTELCSVGLLELENRRRQFVRKCLLTPRDLQMQPIRELKTCQKRFLTSFLPPGGRSIVKL